MSRYVALLRGINVGGKNLITMTKLKVCFENEGFEDVATYIQSGNVLFTSGESGRVKLTRRIEDVLGTVFNFQASVALRTREQMRDIVERAPDGFGSEPTRYRYDVIFLKEPLTAVEALKSVRVKQGVDEAYRGRACSTFRGLSARHRRASSAGSYRCRSIRA